MDADFICKYNKLILYAKKMIGTKHYPFTEYDLAHECFIIDPNLSVNAHKIIQQIFYKELNSISSKPVHKDNIGTQICCGCNEILPINFFIFRTQYKTNRIYNTGVCIFCERKRMREYSKRRRLKDPEGERLRRKIRYWNHVDKNRAELKKRNATESHKLYMKLYREKNKDKIKLQSYIRNKKWRLKNKLNRA